MKDYKYALTKQTLMIQDLLRFNIKTLLVDEYSRITDILRVVEHRFRRRTVFISGSAVDYGGWGRSDTEEFLTRLASALIDRNFRITSGFGLGIGSAVVTGAVQQIYSTKRRSLDEQLVLRPFPLGIRDRKEREKTFARYREELIAQAGISIFVMGNQKVGGKVINADGVRAEFESAKAKGLYLVPVGSSGSMASELWNEVMKQIGSYFPKDTTKIRRWLKAIGKPVKNPTELLEPILKLVEHLAKE